MAHYPQSATGLAYATSPVGPTAAATQITSGGSANTKGSYTEFVAAMAFTANRVEIIVTRATATTGAAHLLDVATGAAGAETVVVPNLLLDINSNGSSHYGAGAFTLPLAVASGTRLAVRNGSTNATQSLFVSLTLVAAGETPGAAAFVNYGANASTSRGVLVDAGGSANTKGAYAALTASTGAVTQVVVPLVSLGSNTIPSAAQWALDVATGAGGAETVLVPDLRLGTVASTGGPRISLRSLTLLTYIPASTRVTARASCDITDATDRLLDVAVLGATAPSEAGGGGTVTVAHGYVG